jgi:Cu/Ag efflux protein CusF
MTISRSTLDALGFLMRCRALGAAALLGCLTGMGTSSADDLTLPKWASPPSSAPAVLHATGFVERIDRTNGSITISHDAMQSMGWPMIVSVRYVVTDPAVLQGVSVGDHVRIAFRKRGVDYEATHVGPFEGER